MPLFYAGMRLRHHTSRNIRKKTHMPRGVLYIIGILVIIVLAIIIVAVIQNSSQNSTYSSPSSSDYLLPDISTSPIPLYSTSPNPSSPSPSVRSTGQQGSTKNFTVTGTDFQFSPSTLQVKQGDTVQVTFVNSGAAPHAFKIDAFNAATPTVQPGGRQTVRFTASTKGTFQFYCPVDGHRQMGMQGNLVVQ